MTELELLKGTDGDRGRTEVAQASAADHPPRPRTWNPQIQMPQDTKVCPGEVTHLPAEWDVSTTVFLTSQTVST